jgi:hypothetical protein
MVHAAQSMRQGGILVLTCAGCGADQPLLYTLVNGRKTGSGRAERRLLAQWVGQAFLTESYLTWGAVLPVNMGLLLL